MKTSDGKQYQIIEDENEPSEIIKNKIKLIQLKEIIQVIIY